MLNSRPTKLFLMGDVVLVLCEENISSERASLIFIVIVFGELSVVDAEFFDGIIRVIAGIAFLHEIGCSFHGRIAL